MLPLSILWYKSSNSKFVQFPKLEGMFPDNWLWWRRRSLSCLRGAREFGIFPEITFPLMSRRRRCCKVSKSSRMFPSNLLLLKYNLSIFSRFPNHGMLPFKIFSLKFRKVRLLILPICGGMFPCIYFSIMKSKTNW